VTRFGPETVVALNADLEVSSSDVVAISTSLRSDDRNDGSPFVSLSMRELGDDGRSRPLACRLELAMTGDAEDDDSGLSSTLRVLGRFSFRSGSCGGDVSAGEAVTDRDFLFRLLGDAVSISFAFSNAPQALVSSTDSTGVGGVWSRSLGGAAARNTSRAPWRPAIFNRRCHSLNLLVSSATRRCDRL
jgi:hypothetical protein